MKVLLGCAMATKSQNGRVTDNQRSLVQSVLHACATTPTESTDVNAHLPSRRSVCKQLGIPETSGRRIFKLVCEKRKLIRRGLELSDWSKVKSRDGFWTKVDEKLRSKIDSWIRSHHHVIHSSIAKDTLLVPDPCNTGQFVRKSKLILQTSVRDLLIDLYKPGIGMLEDVMDKDGKRLVSDIMFQALLPPELRMMSNYYKTMWCS